jgi:cell wall-associated NlpC family hydrolase
MFWKRLALFGFFASLLVSTAFAQESRPRRAQDNTQSPSVNSQTIVVPSASSKQVPASTSTNNQTRSLVSSNVYSQPRTNALVTEPFVRETAISRPAATTVAKAKPIPASAAAFDGRMVESMNSWYGTPYHYGSEGPSSIDCSALVWRVFSEAGADFTRTSARNYWNQFPVATTDEERQFGTLVFFNGLGHVGIVVDENTFYHASSSKGATFSKFEGYWEKRIVGYRRVPLAAVQSLDKMRVSLK